jgi:putative flippase GtrA
MAPLTQIWTGTPCVRATTSGQRLAVSRLGRIFRSLCVAAVTTVVGLTTLAVLVLSDVTTPATANVISAIVCIGPSFALNRRWVWNGAGYGNWRREVAPFWGYSLLSLVLSTVAVAIAGHWADSIGALPEQRTVIILGANILASGTRWIGQFLLLDKVLFRPHHATYVAAPAGGA